MQHWRLLLIRFLASHSRQQLLRVATEYALGFVIVGSATVAPVVIITHHIRLGPAHPAVAKVTKPSSQPAKQPVKPPQLAKAPSPPAPQPAVAPTVTQSAPTPPPQPVTSSQPTPGSGAKSLAPAPSQSSSGQTTTSSPTQSDSSSDSSSSGSSSSGSDSSPPAATGGYTSSNWSGYVATTASYNAITGSWTVPTAAGNGTSTSADAAWIGIGGITTDDLVQAGTEDTVSANGQQTTYAFYEMLPAPALLITSMVISAGDQISASLTETAAATWQVTITDETSRQTYSTTINYDSSNSSAEWILEDPSYANGSQVPFDNFGSVTFTDGSTTVSAGTETISASGAEPITMLGPTGQPIATPSVLISSGTGFIVTQPSG